jgi:hypothetical protein
VVLGGVSHGWQGEDSDFLISTIPEGFSKKMREVKMPPLKNQKSGLYIRSFVID